MSEEDRKNTERYTLGADGAYTVRDYLHAKPFSSFLSGIAGVWGKPLWAHYVNRGQAIACFGIQDKNHAFLEFQSARLHQSRNGIEGFRTFLRLSRKDGACVTYEPFRQHEPGAAIELTLTVYPHKLTLAETNPLLGIETRVEYCILAQDCIPGLLRRLRVRNLGGERLDVELLDGVPRIMTYGLTHSLAKDMPFVSDGYLEVVGDPCCLPLIRLSTRSSDSWKMERMQGGHCFGGVGSAGGRILPSVVDPDRVFGEYQDSERAWAFEGERPYDPSARQGVNCQSCCGFIHNSYILESGDEGGVDSCWTTLLKDGDVAILRERLEQPEWFDTSFAEAGVVTRGVMSRAFLASGSKALNCYMPQTYLDNVLRGGLPISLPVKGREPVVFHVFNRKHGDLERDYNFFSLAPTYFSQGDGNFRDVNQNRRHDVWFNTDVGDGNIRYFANLLQPDGYNPLVCKGSAFVVRDQARARDVLLRVLPAASADKVLGRVSCGFAPGVLFDLLEDVHAAMPDRGAFLAAFLASCEKVEQAEFGEGFWIDHWFYLLDQIESYLAIYPERKVDLLCGRRDYTWYDSAVRVLTREEKHVLCSDGVVRQVDAIEEDEHKESVIAGRPTHPHLVRDASGKVYTSTLLQKLMAVVVTRLASFSPSGLGLDMEAGRPGWHDSINGLPGIFGSSTSEQYQLRRMIEFLLESIGALKTAKINRLAIPVELNELAIDVAAAMVGYGDESRDVRDFNYWDRTARAEERYRASVYHGFSGKEVDFVLGDLEDFLRRGLSHVMQALERAIDQKSGMPLTYYRHKAVKWEPVVGADGKPKRHALGTPVRVTAFEVQPLPLFIEGVLHAMRTEAREESCHDLYRRMRASPLFDKDLEMYIVGDSVREHGPEVGRIWAWSPGWFENENVFLHAEHKYILNCLHAGLCEDAWRDFRNCALPFQPMDRLGRNPLENASFIMSSRQPKAGYAGRGYQPRSSGTTAEVLEFMLVALFGARPFRVDAAGVVSCVLEPRLPAWMFTDKAGVFRRVREDGSGEEVALPAGSCAALFLSKTLVIYENPGRKATFGPGSVRVVGYKVCYADGREMSVAGPVLGRDHALALRSGSVSRLLVSLAG